MSDKSLLCNCLLQAFVHNRLFLKNTVKILFMIYDWKCVTVTDYLQTLTQAFLPPAAVSLWMLLSDIFSLLGNQEIFTAS